MSTALSVHAVFCDGDEKVKLLRRTTEREFLRMLDEQQWLHFEGESWNTRHIKVIHIHPFHVTDPKGGNE